MALTDQRSGRNVAAVAAVSLLVAACSPTPVPSGSAAPTSVPAVSPPASPAPATGDFGGTITILTHAEQLNHTDPQRVYTAEDLAFLGATIYRSLVWYRSSPDDIDGTTLVPDLATDIGTATDGGRTWRFTLRDGVTFQTGAPITCEDVRYGVSRTFANVVISEGPTYAIQHLDIPAATDADSEAGYLSSYRGPYDSTPEQQALFDRAVECSPDHRTITFRLNKPVADFNYATTLGFSPVPQAADTGETYGQGAGDLPVSSGPYQVESYLTGEAGRLVLTRNPNWNPASDPIRKAYPDRWEIEFGIDPPEIARRVADSVGQDAFALSYATFEPETVGTMFTDSGAPLPELGARAVSGFDPYVRYYWINVRNVPNVQVRQAMLVALDRAAIRDVYGGERYGAYADGVVKPQIGRDYAPTGIWDDFFGEPIPESGDPELARGLLRASGEDVGVLRFSAPDTPTNQQVVKIVIDSLARAGLTVEFAPPCLGLGYCSIVFDPSNIAEFGSGGWGHDWPNASTAIPPVFTQAGGWDLSQVDDPAFNAAVADALSTLDRAAQARKWQDLNREAVENAWVIPTFLARDYRIAGTNIGPIYQWPAYSSWPYAELRVTH